jgi:hypothetical protein
MRGFEGLSDNSYWIAVGHFSSCHPPKGLWLLNRVKEIKGMAMGATRTMTGERVASSSHINDILELKATAQPYTDCLPPLALALAFSSLRRPQTAPIVRCGCPSSCLWKPLVEGIGRGDIWPIGRILLC